MDGPACSPYAAGHLAIATATLRGPGAVRRDRSLALALPRNVGPASLPAKHLSQVLGAFRATTLVVLGEPRGVAGQYEVLLPHAEAPTVASSS